VTHRALALKYRPQVFADLVGQEHVSTVLARALEGGRVAHAYLFTGARGVGKTTTARILAKSLNCERRASGDGAPAAGGSGADPCNACTSCVEITGGVSLDVAEIDGASNRGIADVQALREKVRFTPTGGRHRVVIIDEVHQLSNDAFAALLKTLEEPPPHLVFIFATTDPQKLPDTIRSRTQRFDFARVPLRKVAERLQAIQRREAEDPQGTRFTLGEGGALLIAQKSEGSMRDAVSALDQVISSGETEVDEELVRRVLGIADREAFFALAGAIVRRDPRAALQALHQGFEKGLDPRDLAEGLSEHLRHLLVLKVDPDAADLIPVSAEDLARLRAQTEGWSEHDLLRLLRNASEVSMPMRESPQPLVHLEAAVLQMATMEPGDTLAELLARLEALERRLADGAGAGGDAGGTAGPGAQRSAARATVPETGRAAAPPAASPQAPARRSAGAPAGMPPRRPDSPRASFAPPREDDRPIPAADAASGAVATPAGAQPDQVATLEADPAPATDRAWQAVIAAVNDRKRMLGAFLQESRFTGVSERGLELGMDELHRNVIEERQNRAIVADEVARAFGRRLAVHCTVLAGTPLRASDQDVKPMIERAIAWFEGDVVERGRVGERTPGDRVQGERIQE
jgi:DNA polymerase III subunit gamma/tau